jgi:hypothetical protein
LGFGQITSASKRPLLAPCVAHEKIPVTWCAPSLTVLGVAFQVASDPTKRQLVTVWTVTPSIFSTPLTGLSRSRKPTKFAEAVIVGTFATSSHFAEPLAT